MCFCEQCETALAEFDALLRELARAQEVKRNMEALALELRAHGMQREVLANRMVDVLGMKLATARKSLQTLEQRSASGDSW